MEISAVIPAYNEEERIGNVLGPLSKCPLITHIIVVDDGSKDNTSSIAQQYHVELIRLEKNKGKAEAIKRGLQRCSGEIVLLLDADLIGLCEKHIEDLIDPLIHEDVDMTIGVFHSGRLVTDMAQKISPYLSGQRAFKGYLKDEILKLKTDGYSLEIALSKLIKNKNVKIKNVTLYHISHVIKEEKVGILKGLFWRMKMYKDIINYWLK